MFFVLRSPLKIHVELFMGKMISQRFALKRTVGLGVHRIYMKEGWPCGDKC